MRGDAERGRVSRFDPLAGERAIGASLTRQPRQEPGRADVREEPDPDFRHREAETLAGDAMRAVDRDPNAAAHHDAIDDGDVGLAIALDDGIEPVFIAPEAKRFVEAAGATEIIERAQIAAGGE